MIDVDRTLRRGPLGVGCREIFAQTGSKHLGTHLLEELQLVADAPEHKVAIPANADSRIGDDEDFAGIVFDRTDELLLTLRPFIFRESPPGGIELVKAKIHELASRWLLRGLCFGACHELLRMTS